jgi:hypothetical protein
MQKNRCGSLTLLAGGHKTLQDAKIQAELFGLI